MSPPCHPGAGAAGGIRRGPPGAPTAELGGDRDFPGLAPLVCTSLPPTTGGHMPLHVHSRPYLGGKMRVCVCSRADTRGTDGLKHVGTNTQVQGHVRTVHRWTCLARCPAHPHPRVHTDAHECAGLVPHTRGRCARRKSPSSVSSHAGAGGRLRGTALAQQAQGSGCKPQHPPKVMLELTLTPCVQGVRTGP